MTESRKIYYRSAELEAAAKYISLNNPNGFTVSQCKESMIETLEYLSNHCDSRGAGTMGYHISLYKDEDMPWEAEIRVTPLWERKPEDYNYDSWVGK